MIMKVFAKGQVVIPSHIRRTLGIAVGDNLDVRVDEKRGVIELSRVQTNAAGELAGSLFVYKHGKSFPNKRSMAAALSGGLSRDG
ncbi:MAG TPA: AbrB/MazE/SpoVT family DNA-binding domain-containing protein [Kiritimatiellia bacterium]|nr:AbrB/MazE/SpoVT family DNA-binding domain-containing protein [Kiritimatiellia bacterium]